MPTPQLVKAVTLFLVLSASSVSANPRHSAVLELEPIGYWPVDEGEGTVLRDRSVNGNHGEIHHTA
jgi:hypothetical protein